ncbi:4-hydroxythreonine-4-phosphate dehydrogenase PdxA [soil metagenome]
MVKPLIGITVGDPAGIGPEIIRAALASGKIFDDFDYVVVGEDGKFTAGQPTAESAQASLHALEEGVARGLSGEFLAVVTGPVSKNQLHQVGFEFPGQTEFFAARTATEDFAMCLTGGRLTVALVTAHIPLQEVAGSLRSEEIVRVGNLLARFSLRRKIAHPRIAVAGLNPHAGENGDLGREEIEIISPAVERLRGEWEGRATFSVPISPDTVFGRAVAGEFDGVLCMYHDQGLIPLKLHAFDEGVNVTLGLPFPRTSPDHGTAFDLAGKGLARPDSMIAAIRLACELARV